MSDACCQGRGVHLVWPVNVKVTWTCTAGRPPSHESESHCMIPCRAWVRGARGSAWGKAPQRLLRAGTIMMAPRWQWPERGLRTAVAGLACDARA